MTFIPFVALTWLGVRIMLSIQNAPLGTTSASFLPRWVCEKKLLHTNVPLIHPTYNPFELVYILEVALFCQFETMINFKDLELV